MSDRPRPLVLPGGDVLIPGDQDDLTVQVMALRAFRPASPRIRAIAAAQLRAAEDALAQAKARQWRHASPRGTSGSLPPPPAGASSGEVITTAQAAALLGVTERQARGLAASGAIAGRRGPRGTWEIDRTSVAAYAAGRRTRGNDCEEPAGPRGRPGAGGGTLAA